MLSNALKFSENGDIIIDVNLKISVTDNGIGLTLDLQNNLFTVFGQTDSSTSRVYGGTGLELSISKKLTELMGGIIGVTSIKGKDSCFWFEILCRPSTTAVEATDRRKSLDRGLDLAR